MTNEELWFIIKVSGAILGLILGAGAWGLKSLIASVLTRLDAVAETLTGIRSDLASQGQKVETAVNEIDTLRNRADSTDKFKTELFQNYKLEKK